MKKEFLFIIVSFILTFIGIELKMSNSEYKSIASITIILSSVLFFWAMYNIFLKKKVL